MLYDLLTPKEHLELFAKLKGVDCDERQERIEDLLERTDLYDCRDYLVKNLSGGQKRKLCVAIALIGDPKVFLRLEIEKWDLNF